jgi:hypothetical protein
MEEILNGNFHTELMAKAKEDLIDEYLLSRCPRIYANDKLTTKNKELMRRISSALLLHCSEQSCEGYEKLALDVFPSLVKLFILYSKMMKSREKANVLLSQLALCGHYIPLIILKCFVLLKKWRYGTEQLRNTTKNQMDYVRQLIENKAFGKAFEVLRRNKQDSSTRMDVAEYESLVQKYFPHQSSDMKYNPDIPILDMELNKGIDLFI